VGDGDGAGVGDDMMILETGVPETDADAAGVADARGLVVLDWTACLTTIRAPSAKN
jgi:hypothetical protein